MFSKATLYPPLPAQSAAIHDHDSAYVTELGLRKRTSLILSEQYEAST